MAIAGPDKAISVGEWMYCDRRTPRITLIGTLQIRVRRNTDNGTPVVILGEIRSGDLCESYRPCDTPRTSRRRSR